MSKDGGRDTNKDKLISLIIRKDTYKDTKPYLLDLLALKEEAVRTSGQAVKDILTTDYNAEAKLYAMRYLKDAFEKGNGAFMQYVETQLLGILVGIAVDELDEKAVTKYAGSSFTKNDELAKFKSILSSLFRMTKECLIKWAQWIPDPNRKFASALAELKRRNVQFDFEFKYFRPENEQLFREYCAKNGVKLATPAAKGEASRMGEVAKGEGVRESKAKVQIHKDPLIGPVEQALAKVGGVKNKGDLEAVEQEFNTAVNEYLENSKDFKEEFLTKWFDDFEKAKVAVVRTLKSVAESKTKEAKEPKEAREEKPKATPGEPEKAKTSKLNNQKSGQAESGKVKASSTKTEKKEKVEKSEPSMPASPRNRGAAEPHPSSSKKVEPVSQSNTLNIKREEIPQANPPVPVPKSPKRSPLSFQQPQRPPPKLPPPPETKKPQPVKPQKKEFQKFQNQLSKITDRVNFSDDDDEQSQQSHEAFELAKQSRLKKKSKLAAIQEQKQVGENRSGLTGGVRSPRNGEEVRQKGNANSKLLQENRHLMERLEALLKELEGEKQEKIQVMRQNKQLEKDLQVARENEAKLSRKVKTSVPMEDYNQMRKDYELEKERREAAAGQHAKIKQEYDSLIEELNETKQRLNDATIHANSQRLREREKEREREKPRQILPSAYDSPNESKLCHRLPEAIAKEQLDADYVRNLTHPSNMHHWLNEVNIGLFKKNILGLSEMFYRDDYVSMLCKSSVYTQNNQQFLSVVLSLQFKSLNHVAPHLAYKNCQELELWTKPLVGEQLLYRQELAVRLHRNPLRIVKAELKVIENLSLTFLFPCMYLSFLREEEFSAEEFDEVFASRAEQVIKSKIVQWSQLVVKEAADFGKVFRRASVSEGKVKFCLSEGIDDRVFMVQIELLRNSKFMLRVLPIPYTEQMVVQAKELSENIVFLIS